jgi:hypothetical protein
MKTKPMILAVLASAVALLISARTMAAQQASPSSAPLLVVKGTS